MNHIAEHELIDLGKRGDVAAVDELFQRYYKTSLSVARRVLSSKADSEDAVQSAYYSAFKNLRTFRADASFGTWIHRIIVNRCLMTIRAPWHRIAIGSLGNANGPAVLDGIASNRPTPEKSAWHREIAAAHDEAVRALPERNRVAYTLYIVSGLSIEEVAETLGLTIGGAKSRIFRARNAMRKSLGTVWTRDSTKYSWGLAKKDNPTR
jgi:RNA polymerase sigma-70 factor, ECF subfamily